MGKLARGAVCLLLATSGALAQGEYEILHAPGEPNLEGTDAEAARRALSR